jgi:phosphate transport system substrate-binding protein
MKMLHDGWKRSEYPPLESNEMCPDYLDDILNIPIFKRKMRSILAYILSGVLFIISGCGPRTPQQYGIETAPPGSSNLKGKITISGAHALSPLAHAFADAYRLQNPGVEFEIKTTGTGAGLEAVTNGSISLAMVSRPLTDEERAEGFFPVPVAKDAVVLIMNRNNPWLQTVLEQGIDPRTLALAYTGEKEMTWGEMLGTSAGEKVSFYTRGDVSGAADLMAKMLYTTPEGLKGTRVLGDVEMVAKVQNDVYAIGFCNLVYAYDNVTRERKEGIQVIPLDLDYNRKISSVDQPYEVLEKIHRAIYLGLYPHSLCRKLCLVSYGRPTDPLLLDFLRWTLTEGQQVVSPTGYCAFNNAEKKVALEIIQ